MGEIVLFDHLEDTEYVEFIKDNFLRTLGQEKPKYRVYLDCTHCDYQWDVKMSQITQAVLEANECGCPRCHRIEGVRLNHHIELQTTGSDDISDFMKFVPL
jgi:hypothetical protein